MKLGIVLPTMTPGASPEGILAAAETAERLAWHAVWVTDHVLVGRQDAARYGYIFEALTTLAWVGARCTSIGLGTSVLVVPQRDAVVLAKELATLDVLTAGRLRVGVGVGWSEVEFGNLAAGDHYHVRGAYLDEAIRLWRHLWSGAAEPFEGRFHRFAEVAFGPLPAQGAGLPIIVGGRSAAAVRRAARLGDGYQVSQAGPSELAERLVLLAASAAEAGRPTPPAAARVAVRFDQEPGGESVLAGDDEAVRRSAVRWAALGLDELLVTFEETDPGRIRAAMERFDREVRPVLSEAAPG